MVASNVDTLIIASSYAFICRLLLVD